MHADPRAIFVATPPMFRGGLTAPRALELDLMKLFPNSALFLEKPVTTWTPWDKSVEEAKEVGKMLREHKAPVGIGYVLRYSIAVQEMKRIIKEKNLTVMATNTRFIVPYALAVKPAWWNKNADQGPIIEQGTHLVDLSMFFGGEIDVDSVSAHAIEAYENPGQLEKLAFDEDVIPMDLRIPRATSASWKYESGAVGTFLHAIALQNGEWTVDFQVITDGYQINLTDPFSNPSLQVRGPGDSKLIDIPMPSDDPYYHEIDGFIDMVEGGPNPKVLASYEDAVRTYEMTWCIRNASEESSRRRKEKLEKKKAESGTA